MIDTRDFFRTPESDEIPDTINKTIGASYKYTKLVSKGIVWFRINHNFKLGDMLIFIKMGL